MQLSKDELIKRLNFVLRSAGMGMFDWAIESGMMRWDGQMSALFGNGGRQRG
jgi:hypothetical protein